MTKFHPNKFSYNIEQSGGGRRETLIIFISGFLLLSPRTSLMFLLCDTVCYIITVLDYKMEKIQLVT